MASFQFELFKSRKFLPIFITQLAGCFNDCLLKSALIILIIYKLYSVSILPAEFMVLIANALFIFPSIFFSGLAGQLADKYERTTLVQIIKLTEIGIVLLSAYGFRSNSISLLYISVFLMGVHSTFFGPLKYSILPDHLEKDKLLSANGFIESGTFIGILMGTTMGGLYTYYPGLTINIMIFISIVGFISSIFIPKCNNYNGNIEINKKILRENLNLINYCKSKKIIFLAILGNSWFWFIGGSFLSQLPILTKTTLGADAGVTNFFLGIFSVGVGIGSILCNKMLKGEITTKYLFLASIGMTIFSIDLFFATKVATVNHEPQILRSIQFFLAKIYNWRIILDLFFIAIISAIYVVPLYAVIQSFSPVEYRSRVIAANNIINSLFIVISNLLLSLLFSINLTVPYIILIIALLNLLIAGYIYRLTPEPQIIPEGIIRGMLRFLFSIFYKVEVKSIENFHNAGSKVVIIANHISYIDAPLLSAYLTGKIPFAINTVVSKKSWVKPFLRFVKTYSIDPSNPMGVKHLIKEIQTNGKVIIFPEGRVSNTGSLMKIYEGPGAIAQQTKAVILPVRIDGAQYTPFSKLKKLLNTRWFGKITISVLPAIKMDYDKYEGNLRVSRAVVSQKLYNIMSQMLFETSGYEQHNFKAILISAKLHGYKFSVLEDTQGNVLNYRQLIIKTYVLGDIIYKNQAFRNSKNIGIMLPNSIAGIVCFYAAQAYGLTAVMINFTSGSHNITTFCRSANVKIIYTSRYFIEKGGLEDIVSNLSENFDIIYLEDLQTHINIVKKLKGLIAGFFPNLYFNYICKDQDCENLSAILATSGTEKDPKLVPLSHRNIQANCNQILSMLDFNNNDVAFNALPLFHSFGLVANILMLNSGVKIFTYPSPIHYKIIPEYIYDAAATIMFTTDTFLNMYAKFAHPYDFFSLRYVFAGAEKLRESTTRLWLEKFGIRIIQGYGATECSPVISFNTPMNYKQDSVGKLIPGIEYKIEDIPGIDKGGKLYVKGPNVMKGYITQVSKDQVHIKEIEDGWYDTGDVVYIDDEGYVFILGRYKRFAKIAGEMISLSNVEDTAYSLEKDAIHGAIVIEDEAKGESKGEKIILFSTTDQVNRENFSDMIKKLGYSSLSLPRQFIEIADMPLLSTGKINYPALMKIYYSDYHFFGITP